MGVEAANRRIQRTDNEGTRGRVVPVAVEQTFRVGRNQQTDDEDSQHVKYDDLEAGKVEVRLAQRTPERSREI